MGESSKKHVMEIVFSGDQAHKDAMEDMMKLSSEDQRTWLEDFKKNFELLPEA